MAIGVGTAILGAAGISGASSLAGGKKGASAATQASQLQYQAAIASLAQQQEIRQQNVNTLTPFVNFGQGGMDQYGNTLTGYAASPVPTDVPQFTEKFNEPFTFDPTQVTKLPSYQFELDQTTKAAQARAAATGQGRGGPAIQGAAQAAAGYVGNQVTNMYNMQLGQWQTDLQGYQTREQAFLANTQNLLAGRTQDIQQRQMLLSALAGRVQTGLQAGGALAGANLSSGQQIGNAITQAGAAQASGPVGAANALTAGLSGVGSAASNAASAYAINAALGSPGGVLGAGGGYSNPAASAATNTYVDYLANQQAAQVAPV